MLSTAGAAGAAAGVGNIAVTVPIARRLSSSSGFAARHISAVASLVRGVVNIQSLEEPLCSRERT